MSGGPSPHGYHSDDELWRCEKEFQLKRIRQVSVPSDATPRPLAVGTLAHSARQLCYSRPALHATYGDISECLYIAAGEQPLPIAPADIEEALRISVAYQEYWSVRPWPKPIATEYVIGPHPILPGSRHVRTATLDDLSWYPEVGALCIGEFKTTSAKPSSVVKFYKQHAQPMLQSLLYRLAPNGEALHGKALCVMLDIVQKPWSGKKPEFAREPLFFEESALDKLATTYEEMLTRKEQIGWDSDVKHQGFGMGCQKNIAGDYTFTCQFRELCMFGRSSAAGYKVGDKWMSDWTPEYEGQRGPWE